MGVKAGVPDLQLLVPNGLIHGLWIELKSKAGKLQPSQRLMQRLEEQGYMCKVCFGADEAIKEIKKYCVFGDGMNAVATKFEQFEWLTHGLTASSPSLEPCVRGTGENH
jgi:hypothetical protein